MTIKLRFPWGGHDAGAVITETFENERGLVAGGAADFVEAVESAKPETQPVEAAEKEAGPVRSPVTKPADVGAANERIRKQALAQKIREAGGTVPHHASGIDKFEAALSEAQG